MTTTTEANTPETNKAAIQAQDRALKAALLLTKENLTAAAKLTSRTIARAEESISKAGLTLMWAFQREGEAYTAVTHDYDRDIAPIVSAAVSEAYGSNKASQKTMRAFAKLFFLAGVHGVDTEETTLNKIVESYREQLKAAGIVKEHGNDKAKRETRVSTANAPKPATTTGPATTTESATSQSTGPVSSTDAAEAPKYNPKKVYTDADRRSAAMILSGSPAAAHKIVKAFETHREQVLKFIEQLMASEAATK